MIRIFSVRNTMIAGPRTVASDAGESITIAGRGESATGMPPGCCGSVAGDRGDAWGTAFKSSCRVCAPAMYAPPTRMATAHAMRAERLWLARERRDAMTVKGDVSFIIPLQGRVAG